MSSYPRISRKETERLVSLEPKNMVSKRSFDDDIHRGSPAAPWTGCPPTSFSKLSPQMGLFWIRTTWPWSKFLHWDYPSSSVFLSCSSLQSWDQITLHTILQYGKGNEISIKIRSADWFKICDCLAFNQVVPHSEIHLWNEDEWQCLLEIM